MAASLRQALAREFSAITRMKGEQYAAAHRIHVESGSAAAVEAVALGTRPYRVSIARHDHGSDATFNVSCECPYFRQEFTPCKHVWATLAVSEQAGYLRGEQQALRHVTLFLEGIDSEYWLGEAAPPRRPPPPDPGSVALDAIESSMRVLESAPAPAFRYAGQELIYMLRPPRAGVNVAVVSVMARTRKKDGQWAKPKPVSLAINDVPRASEPDRSILAALMGAPRSAYSYSAYFAEMATDATFALSGSLPVELLRAILQTGRAFLDAETATTEPYRWDDGPPWNFEVAATRTDRGWRVEGRFVRPGGETLPVTGALVVDDQFLWTSTAIARADVAARLPLLSQLRRTADLEILDRDQGRLALLLAQVGIESSALPADLRVERLDGLTPMPHLRLRRPSPASQFLIGELAFEYDGTLVPQAATRTFYDAPRQRLIVRHSEVERAAMTRALDAGMRRGWDQYDRRERLEITPRELPAVVRALASAGWRIEAEGRPYRTPGGVRLSVSSGIDWFDLDATVDFGEASAPLTEVIAAFQRREHVVRLDDGSMGLLPEEWLRRYLPLAAAGEAVGEQVRFRQPQAALLDALLEDAAAHATVDLDEGFRRARDELARTGRIAPADPPASFVGTLRDYQREGLGWLQFLARAGFGGCLADDMGLGKTVMVLALLDARRGAPEREGRPSIVVVPRSLVHNWLEEAARFAPSLRIVDFSAATREREGRIPDADVLLVTYGTLRRDVLRLKDVEADYAILDEAQAIKNANTASAKAARLLNARHRLVLTGTPIENHLGELWSLFDFLNPGVLGRSTLFARAAGGTSDPETIALLARGLRPFILRRTKQQVARELPARTEQTILCELSKPERTLYDTLRQQYRASVLARVARDGVNGSRMHILEALLRLRQAACHPALVEPLRPHATSAKLELLMERVQEVVDEGHKALVFSQFTTLLGLVRKSLDKAGLDYAYLDGRTRNRAQVVRRFQEDPACSLFLISLKAGGTGLNLTAAEYVFLLDPWWNPAVEAQAIDRTHRIGQTREVFAYRIVADNTIESKILELQQSKRALADAILGASAGGLKSLEREDLEMLLS
jgi:superfamily II DNA or RNA helicase